MDKDLLDSLRGLFEGGNFGNTQINIIPGDGARISFEAPKEKETNMSKKDLLQGKQAIIEYVNRLKPIVCQEYQERYEEIWLGILELNEVKKEVYNKGKQQDTTFNRNLVAQIIHQLNNKIFPSTVKAAQIAGCLEPEKGVDHPVRKKLGELPDKPIRKSVDSYLSENL